MTTKKDAWDAITLAITVNAVSGEGRTTDEVGKKRFHLWRTFHQFWLM